MKLIKIILLVSLANTLHTKNYIVETMWASDIYVALKSFQKIEKLWNYFTPEAQKQIKKIVVQKENVDFKNINLETDLKLLYLILDHNEFFNKRLPIKQFNTILALQKEQAELIDKGFTETEICHQLFNKVLTHDGCKALASDELDSDILLKPLLDALKIHEKLNGLFNEEKVKENQS